MTPIVRLVAPRLVDPALMLAAAIVVRGYTDVGDGFSAAVIVALAVALRYVVLGPTEAERITPWARHAHALAVIGLLAALATGFFGVFLGDPPFTHLPRPGEPVAHIGSLELTTAVAFDIGLFALVTGMLVLLIGRLSRLARGEDA